jgi:hypothetical protein
VEADNSVTWSDRIILECKRCGDSLILLGLEEDWRSEGTRLECRCGAKLTLADRTDDEAIAIKKLLQDSIRAPSNPEGGS